MNRYPVIFLSFKDAKGNRTLMVKQVKLALLAEYQRPVILLIDEYDTPFLEENRSVIKIL